MTFTETMGYAASLFVLLTFSMKTMVQLRIVGILSNLFFIAYGYLSGANPIMILHCILLPLNMLRLQQIRTLVRQVEDATRGDMNWDWLKSITKRRNVKAGESLFRKGEAAESMMFIVSGAFHVSDLEIEVGKGQLIGELGLLAVNNTRTRTVTCIADSEVLEITYDQVRQLYFQSPKFGFYFLQLASRRLFEDIERLDRELAACRQGLLMPA
jgi:CRP/FNR family transcriptional regulator, cyclic AMP receptor protein